MIFQIILCLVAFFLGVLFSSIIITFAIPIMGDFVIDFTDPTKDLYRIEFDQPMEELPFYSKVILRVKVNKDVSQ